MASSLEISALNLAGAIARGYASHHANGIEKESLDPRNPLHLDAIHQASLRLLFSFLITLYIEEIYSGVRTPETGLNDDSHLHGLCEIRKQFCEGKKEFGGKRLGLLKKIHRAILTVSDGDENYAPFKARLLSKSNPFNQCLLDWKLYDSDLDDSLSDLFRILPHPGKSLLDLQRPSLREIIDIYPYLLNFQLLVANTDMVVRKNGESAVPVPDAHPSDLHHGKLIAQGLPYFHYTKDKCRKGGIVYTPDYVIGKIIERTITPLLDEKPLSHPLRILDPSCGTGRFLIKAFEHLCEKNPGSNDSPILKRKIISDSIYGVDTDPLAVELAEITLMLETQTKSNPAPTLNRNLIVADALVGVDSTLIKNLLRTGRQDNDDRCQSTFDEINWSELWKNVMASDDPQSSAFRLKNAFNLILNYLKTGESDLEKTLTEFKFKAENFNKLKQNGVNSYNICPEFLHPELSFPHLYFDSSGDPLCPGGFDIIIGNPPYGDLLSSESKNLLKTLGYESGGGGNNDIFRFFVERGLNLLRPGGMLGFILPNTFLKGGKYRIFRHRILELAYPEEILDFDLGKIFNRDVFTALLFLRKKPSRKIPPIFITSLDGTIQNVKSEKFDPEKTVDDSWYPSGDLLSQLQSDKRFVPLDPFIARIGDVGINYQRKDVGWTQRAPSRIASEIFYEGEREHPEDLPYLKGEDVEPFVVKCKSPRWLRHDWKSRIHDGEIVSVNLDWAHRPAKILSRQTGDSIIAAVDSSGFLTGRSLHTTIPRDARYSPWYLLAILNSDIINRIYREMTRESGRALAQVKLSSLRRLPIRTIMFNGDESGYENIIESEKNKLNDNPALLPGVISEMIVSGRESIVHDLIAFSSSKIQNLLQNCNNGNSNGVESWRDPLMKAIESLYLTSKI